MKAAGWTGLKGGSEKTPGILSNKIGHVLNYEEDL